MTASSAVGFVDRDPKTNAETYWCGACVPEWLLRCVYRVDQDEAEERNAHCERCRCRLADIYVQPESPTKEEPK